MGKKYDLIVVGGGFAGVMAACAAGREKLSVLLIEKSGVLGGAACLNYVLPFMRYRFRKGDRWGMLNRGLFKEFLRRMRAYSETDGKYVLSDSDQTFSEEFLKIVMDDMTDDYGVEVLFHSAVTGATVVGDAVTAVEVYNASGKYDLFADYIIDATGDANLALLSNCNVTVGRESDGKCQPMTLCFRMGNVDVNKYYAEDFKRVNALWAERLKAGKLINPRENILAFRHSTDNVLHLNSTRVLMSPVDAEARSKAEKVARKQMLELYRFLKENAPSCKDATLLSSATEIGVRESRMVKGMYTLTGEDVVACRKFDDAIAAGNYDIDIHSPDGSGTSHYWVPEGEFYTIPYRALVPDNKSNMLVCGRCISSTHEAQASYRIMPIVACIGEGAGIAAALAKNKAIAANAILTEDLRKAIDKYDLVEGYGDKK